MNPFAPGTAALIALFAMRIGGALLIAPVFASRTVPRMVRVALLLVLTATLFPVVSGQGAAPAVTAATLLSETLVGFAIGMGAAVFVGASEVAGDLLALQTGLSAASTLDPLTQFSTPVLAEFMQLVAVTLLLAMNGHELILDALASSVHVVPVGGAIAVQSGLHALVALGGQLFSIGVRVAAPVMAAVFISNLALGILARTAPQMQIFMLAYPLQIVVGLFALAMALPLIGSLFLGWPGHYTGVAGNLLDALAR